MSLKILIEKDRKTTYSFRSIPDSQPARTVVRLQYFLRLLPKNFKN